MILSCNMKLISFLNRFYSIHLFKGLFLSLTLLICLLFAVGCSDSTSESQRSSSLNTTASERKEKLQIVTTTTMITDLVKQIGREFVEVHGLMGPGVDPHLYKATASDLAQMQRADIIFYNGLMLEGTMSELFQQMGKRGKKVYAVTDKIPKDKLLIFNGSEGHPDPHTWFDPTLWSTTVDQVVEVLSQNDSTHAEEYKKRGDAYREQIMNAHEWAIKRLGEIPPAQKVLITSHDAFNYFGRAYGFEVVGVQGISTVSEAGLADITKTVDLIRARKIKAIFVESSVPRANIERIATDSGAKVGAELFSDAAGTPGEMETIENESYDLSTYIGMFRHNVHSIAEALK